MRNCFETKLILGVLLASLSAASATFAQSQSQPRAQAPAQTSPQAATPSKSQGQSDAASASSSASTQAKTQNTSAEPQMESQEAPPAESLGEAARRARAQKAAAPAAKVYTEDKVARLSNHGVSVVGDGNQSGDSSSAENTEDSEREPSAGGTPKASSQAGNSDEKMWREKARAIHDQMAQIDERISKIQEEIQKYGAVSFDPASGLRQNVIYVEDRNAQIKQLEEQKAKLQSQLDSLEEEGRKAGADSGWFR